MAGSARHLRICNLYYFVFFAVLGFERGIPVFPEREGRVDVFELVEGLLFGDFLDA